MSKFVSLAAESSYRFLLKDSTEDFAIISTNNLIELANGCTKISVDGTFYTVPKFAKRGQLFTVFGEFSGKYIPMFFTLMLNRQKDTYDRLFRKIKNLSPGLNPVQCISDFEMAAMSSVSEAFPLCNVVGCFFHYTQAIRKTLLCMS